MRGGVGTLRALHVAADTALVSLGWFASHELQDGRKDLPMHQNLQYDFHSIRNRSLALDASILLRTAGAVLSRRGAF